MHHKSDISLFRSLVDYTTHRTTAASVIDWFDGKTPVLGNEYSTVAFGRKTRAIFEKETEPTKPQFVFLSMNAPHLPVRFKVLINIGSTYA